MINNKETNLPPQRQETQPGYPYKMDPQPQANPDRQLKEKKLFGKTALISGGDSGIGRAIALAFVAEGARVAIAYLNEGKDAKETEDKLKNMGGK